MGLSEQFQAELDLITNDRIRAFAAKGLDVAPAYLTTIPSSTRAHHPRDERGEGGRVLHLKRVALLTFLMAEPLRWDDHHRDLMVAAALLHDVVCNGPSHEPTERAWKEHDQHAMDYLLNHGMKGMIDVADRLVIEEAIRGHMGRWASNPHFEPKPGTPGHYLHLIDYIASRVWVTVETIPVNERGADGDRKAGPRICPPPGCGRCTPVSADA